MINKRKFDLVIFDMDGVILRSDLLYYEIAKKINSEIDQVKLSTSISQGGKILFESIFGKDYTEQNVSWFRKMQVKKFNQNHHLYDDIVNIIMNVSKTYKLAIVSNKPITCIEGILRQINIYDLFDVVIGRDSGLAIKPEPDGINHVVQSIGVDKRRVVYLGDSISDYRACEKAEITFAHCRYGFDASTVKCDYVLYETNQIESILEI
tara:strand:- start:328 stop:951 length:624 start_codon:yes stop_codon:yes gene_type:complete